MATGRSRRDNGWPIQRIDVKDAGRTVGELWHLCGSDHTAYWPLREFVLKHPEARVVPTVGGTGEARRKHIVDLLRAPLESAEYAAAVRAAWPEEDLRRKDGVADALHATGLREVLASEEQAEDEQLQQKVPKKRRRTPVRANAGTPVGLLRCRYFADSLVVCPLGLSPLGLYISADC
jgi:hypothetical protein